MKDKPWHNFDYDEDYSLNQLAKIYSDLVKRAQIALIHQGSLYITDPDLVLLRNLSHYDTPDEAYEVMFWYRQKIHNLIVVLSRIYNGKDGIKFYSLTNAALVKLKGISNKAASVRIDLEPVLKRLEFLIKDIFGFDVKLILRFNTDKISITLLYNPNIPLTLSQVEEQTSICLPTDDRETMINNDDVTSLIRSTLFDRTKHRVGNIINAKKGKLSINGRNIASRVKFKYGRDNERYKKRRWR